MRVAIIGAGLMGRWHAHAAVRAGATIAVVLDRDAHAAGRLAARHGASPTTDLERALAEAEALHVCTPMGTHAALVERALAAGRHVLVEKPLVETRAEAERLYDLARDRGVLLCPVHQLPFSSGITRLEEQADRLGDVVHVGHRITSAGADLADPRAMDEVVADVLPHSFSLFPRILAGALAGEAGDWWVLHPAPGELRCGRALPGGATCEVLVSMRARPTSHALTVLGTRGSAEVDLFHGFCALEPGRVSRADKILRPFDRSARTVAAASANLARRTVRRQPAYPGLGELVSRFYEAARKGGPPPLDPAEVLRGAALRDALLARAGLR